jgi:hypothetical protein
MRDEVKWCSLLNCLGEVPPSRGQFRPIAAGSAIDMARKAPMLIVCGDVSNHTEIILIDSTSQARPARNLRSPLRHSYKRRGNTMPGGVEVINQIPDKFVHCQVPQVATRVSPVSKRSGIGMFRSTGQCLRVAPLHFASREAMEMFSHLPS